MELFGQPVSAGSGIFLLLALAMAPDKEKTPPLWIRGLLVLTCTGVSFAFGLNVLIRLGIK